MAGPGQDYVTFAELITEAHKRGFQGLSTELLDYKMDENVPVYAVVTATAKFESGTYEAIGDATRENTNRGIGPHLIRMASTRAMARALRVALGVGRTALEELGGGDPGETEGTGGARDPEAPLREGTPGNSGGPREPSPGGPPATITKAQESKIRWLTSQLRYKTPDLSAFSEADAKELIERLEQERRGSPAPRGEAS